MMRVLGWSSDLGGRATRVWRRTWYWLDHGHPRLDNGAAIMTMISLPVLFITLYAGLVAATLLPSPIDRSATVEFEDSLAGQTCFDSEAALLRLHRVDARSPWFDIGSRLKKSRSETYEAWFLIGNGAAMERRAVTLDAGVYQYTIQTKATLVDGRNVTGHSRAGSTITVRAGDEDRSLLLSSDCPTGDTYVITICEGSGCLGT